MACNYLHNQCAFYGVWLPKYTHVCLDRGSDICHRSTVTGNSSNCTPLIHYRAKSVTHTNMKQYTRIIISVMMVCDISYKHGHASPW